MYTLKRAIGNIHIVLATLVAMGLSLHSCGISTVEKSRKLSGEVDSLYQVGHQAYERFRAAARSNPSQMRQHYVVATSAFRKALDIDSTHVPSLRELSIILAASKKDEEASRLLRRGIDLDSTDAELYMHLGLSQIRQGYVAGGHAILKAALQRDSSDVIREQMAAHLTAHADEAMLHSWGYPEDGDKRKDYRMFAIANWIISHDVFPKRVDVLENILQLADTLDDNHTVELYKVELEKLQ